MKRLDLKYGFYDMRPNHRHVVDLDGHDTIADLKRHALRFAADNGMTCNFDRIHGARAHINFVRASESMLRDPSER
jgi:hypothetical protein